MTSKLTIYGSYNTVTHTEIESYFLYKAHGTGLSYLNKIIGISLVCNLDSVTNNICTAENICCDKISTYTYIFRNLTQYTHYQIINDCAIK